MGRIAKLVLTMGFTAGFALWSQIALSEEQANALTVQQILDSAVAKSKEHEKLSKKYTFLQRVTVENLDDEGKVEKKEELVLKSIPVGDTQYDRLIKKNGKPLEGDDLEEEQEREREFREDLKKGKKPKGQEEGSFTFDEKFVSKYNFTLQGQAEVNGRGAYVLKYKPKSKDLPEENVSDRFMNKTKGTLWIDQEDFVISKAQTTLLEPVKILGGIVASIKKMDFTIVLKKKGDEWFPSAMHQKVSGRKLVSSFDMRVKITFDSFEKVAP
jgi:hypothetical protein